MQASMEGVALLKPATPETQQYWKGGYESVPEVFVPPAARVFYNDAKIAETGAKPVYDNNNNLAAQTQENNMGFSGVTLNNAGALAQNAQTQVPGAVVTSGGNQSSGGAAQASAAPAPRIAPAPAPPSNQQ